MSVVVPEPTEPNTSNQRTVGGLAFDDGGDRKT